jgi:uncharacterized small protein (DUF1192 family)
MTEIEKLYQEVIKSSQANVNLLSEKLHSLSTLRQEILDWNKEANDKVSIASDANQEIPKAFKTKFDEIANTAKSYTETLGKATSIYLAGNNDLFNDNITKIAEQTDLLKSEIERLVATDFKTHFENLQKTFIDQTHSDLEIELKKFDNKAADLQENINSLNTEVERLVRTDFKQLFEGLQKEFISQTHSDLVIEFNKFDEKTKDLQVKINLLNTEIEKLIGADFKQLFEDLQITFIEQTRNDLAIERNKFDEKAQAFQKNVEDFRIQNDRIEKIDLEKGFGELQKTLADIFSAINSINGTFTNVVQTLGIIQTSIISKYETTIKHLTEQDKQAAINVEIFENKIAILMQKNELFFENVLPQINQLTIENVTLKQEIKINRIIQIVGILVTIIFFTYLINKQKKSLQKIYPNKENRKTILKTSQPQIC